MQLDGLPTRDELLAIKDQMRQHIDTQCSEIEGRLAARLDSEVRRLEQMIQQREDERIESLDAW